MRRGRAGAGARCFIAWRTDLGSRLSARERVHDRAGGLDDAPNPFGSSATRWLRHQLSLAITLHGYLWLLAALAALAALRAARAVFTRCVCLGRVASVAKRGRFAKQSQAT